MALRNFSNTASIGILAGDLNNTDLTSTVALSSGAPTGWPSTPCVAAISKDETDEEVVLVTAISGSSVTFTRGYDSTSTVAHTAGATLTHVASAIEYREANTHVNSSSGVHGIAGAVVGTTDSQTLTNKTLTAPTVADLTNIQHDHSGATKGGLIPQSSVSGLVSALGTKANDTAVAHLTGDETLAGNKTFSGTTAAQAISGTNLAASGTLKVAGDDVLRAVSGDFKVVSASTGITTDSNGKATISFGTTFGGTPTVVATITTTTDAHQYMTIVGRNTTAFTVEVYSGTAPNTNVSVGISWIAIGS